MASSPGQLQTTGPPLNLTRFISTSTALVFSHLSLSLGSTKTIIIFPTMAMPFCQGIFISCKYASKNVNRTWAHFLSIKLCLIADVVPKVFAY